MADPSPRSNRGLLLIGGGVLIWILALLWTLNRKGYIEAPSFIGGPSPSASADAPEAKGEAEYGEAPVSEILVEAETESEAEPGRGRGSGSRAVAESETGADERGEGDETGETGEPEGPPTYPVWFESERSIGVCKISYEGGAKTANLHVSTRMPEGKLSFSYHCGKFSGRGNLQVKPNRVNGVLFCRKDGGVKVKTVRSKESRCG